MDTSDDSDDASLHEPEILEPSLEGSQTIPIAIGSSPPESPHTPSPTPSPTPTPAPPTPSDRATEEFYDTSEPLPPRADVAPIFDDQSEAESEVHTDQTDDEDEAADEPDDDHLTRVYAYATQTSSPFYESLDGSDSGQSGVVRINELALPPPGWGGDDDMDVDVEMEVDADQEEEEEEEWWREEREWLDGRNDGSGVGSPVGNPLGSLVGSINDKEERADGKEENESGARSPVESGDDEEERTRGEESENDEEEKKTPEEEHESEEEEKAPEREGESEEEDDQDITEEPEPQTPLLMPQEMDTRDKDTPSSIGSGGGDELEDGPLLDDELGEEDHGQVARDEYIQEKPGQESNLTDEGHRKRGETVTDEVGGNAREKSAMDTLPYPKEPTSHASGVEDAQVETTSWNSTEPETHHIRNKETHQELPSYKKKQNESDKSGSTAKSMRLPRPTAVPSLPSPFYIRTIQTEIKRINKHDIYGDMTETGGPLPMVTSTIGDVHWKGHEKEKFFNALAAVGKDALPEIARRVGTKSELECSDYLYALQEGVEQRLELSCYRPGTELVMPWHIPMAFEIPEDLEAALDWESERLRKELQRRGDRKIRDTWGDHAIIDEDIAEFLDQCIEKEDEESLEMVAPEAVLLNVSQMLSLSKWLFMNGPGDANFRSVDPDGRPNIYYTALRYFHKLVVGITRRLVVCSMLAAETRQDQYSRDDKMPLALIHPDDVRSAAESLGLPVTGREYWISVARRNKLRVVQTTHELNYANSQALTYEQVEGFLSRVESQHRAREFGNDMDIYEKAKEDEESAYKRAYLSLQPRSPSPEIITGEADEGNAVNTDDDQSSSDSDFVSPSSPEPHGPILLDPRKETQHAIKRDRIRFYKLLDSTLDRIDKHLNARSTAWHWRRFFRQSRPFPREPPPLELPLIYRKRILYPQSNWRKSARLQAFCSRISRKPNLSELIQKRLRHQRERKPGPWQWNPRSNRDTPSWLPRWQYHRFATSVAPEPEGKKWEYSTGRWVTVKPYSSSTSISLAALRKERKLDIRRRSKLGKAGELVEPGIAPPVIAFPLLRWKKYTRGNGFQAMQTENMVLRAWIKRPRPVLWGTKYQTKEEATDEKKTEATGQETYRNGGHNTSRGEKTKRKRPATHSDATGDQAEHGTGALGDTAEPDSSSPRHKKPRILPTSEGPLQLLPSANSPEAFILTKALPRSPSSLTSKGKLKKRKQSPTHPESSKAPKRRHAEEAKGAERQGREAIPASKRAKLSTLPLRAVVERSPRKQRQRRKSSIPSGFVSIVDADLGEGSGNEGAKILGDSGEQIHGVDDGNGLLVGDSTESEYEE